MTRFLQSLFVCVIASQLVGCGGAARGTVSGKVTLDGQPVTAGSVSFTNGNSVDNESAAIQSDGTYSSTNVPTGEVRVSVYVPSAGSAMPAGAPKLPPSVPADHPQAKMYADKAKGTANVPTTYSDPATSGLTVKVDSGSSQTYDIALKSKT